MNILHVNTSDTVGGAANIALQLHHACLNNGMQSRMVVGVKRSNDPTVTELPHNSYKSFYSRFLLNIARSLECYDRRIRGVYRLRKTVKMAAEPRRHLDVYRGLEDFDFPGTWHLLNGHKPDLVHCHNLHGGYFDLNALSWLSSTVPVILTLHDSWLLSGHCAHSLDCEKWKSGCGDCPYLAIYPAVRRDKTAENWNRKKQVYEKSRLRVATPSQWLMKRVMESILAPAITDSKVIPNGVDVSLFRPGDKKMARKSLEIPPEAVVLLSVGNQIASNPFKDFRTLKESFQLLIQRHADQKYLLIVLGEEGPVEPIGQSEIRMLPYETDRNRLVSFYQAADLYVHSAKVDTFPTTVLEALACGVPVLANDAGGIPEQVRITGNQTGVLVQGQDIPSMAEAMERLLFNNDWRKELAVNARADALERFPLSKQTEQYLTWYTELVN